MNGIHFTSPLTQELNQGEMMADGTNDKQSSKGRSPDPFIARLSLNFLKSVSLILAVICFISAAFFLGFTIYGVLLSTFGGKPFNKQYFAAGIFSSLIIGLFGRWFLQRSEYMKREKTSQLQK